MGRVLDPLLQANPKQVSGFPGRPLSSCDLSLALEAQAGEQFRVVTHFLHERPHGLSKQTCGSSRPASTRSMWKTCPKTVPEAHVCVDNIRGGRFWSRGSFECSGDAAPSPYVFSAFSLTLFRAKQRGKASSTALTRRSDGHAAGHTGCPPGTLLVCGRGRVRTRLAFLHQRSAIPSARKQG